MPNVKMVLSVLKEYGAGWAAARLLYSLKLRLLNAFPPAERLFEKTPDYPKRLDLFRIDTDALGAFLQNGLSEEDKEKLIAEADNACKGVFKGFNSITLDYGDPIDWQLSPLTGKRCGETKKWFTIPDFDSERGDIKAIWEASRFSHFPTLARAYLLTRDEKYYRAFSSQLADWLEKNPYGCGANFKCGQECSIRMVNALLAFTVFRTAGAAKDADAGCMKDLVDRCYRKVLGNFFYAYRCIKNNHTISELMGMIAGAWCCGDRRRLAAAYRLLDKVIGEQFASDGGYRQFSFNYQRLALQVLEAVMSASKQTGFCLSESSMKKIENSALLLYQCQDESGDVPNYGNNDGALIFPVSSCGYRDFCPAINASYALSAGKQLYENGKCREELIWFSGGKSLREYPLEKKEKESSRFAEAGLFTIRGGDFWAMIVSNDYSSRPGHMDQLHFDLWIGGVNVLCDAGTYSYAGAEGRRYAGNESHNTASVDGKPQMNSAGPFLIYGRTKREIVKADASSFEGKAVSANGYTHRRRVVLSGSSFEIADKADKDYSIAFHTPCEAALENGAAILSYKGKRLCSIRCNGPIELQKAQRSLFYLKQDAASRLTVRGLGGTETKTTIEIAKGN